MQIAKFFAALKVMIGSVGNKAPVCVYHDESSSWIPVSGFEWKNSQLRITAEPPPQKMEDVIAKYGEQESSEVDALGVKGMAAILSSGGKGRIDAVIKLLAESHPCVTANLLVQGTIDGNVNRTDCLLVANLLTDMKINENQSDMPDRNEICHALADSFETLDDLLCQALCYVEEATGDPVSNSKGAATKLAKRIRAAVEKKSEALARYEARYGKRKAPYAKAR